MVGSVYDNGGVHRPHPNHTYPAGLPRFKVPTYMYNQSTLPTYLVGGGYVMHYKQIKCLYKGIKE